jgi:DNA-binding GntR family transcriptional regulator
MKSRKTADKGKREDMSDFLNGLRPVEKQRSMAEVVYKSLKNAIVNGDLKPGQRLVEQKLSDQMKTSRVPVREAIKRLEQYGFVQRLPVRGIIVKKISEEDINEAFGIRAALESYAAYQATEHASKELLAALDSCIEASFKALEKGDLEKVMELNTEFHEIVYRAAKSDMLYKLIATFLDYIARYKKPLLSSKANAYASLEGHKVMVDAMRRGDKENVERIVKSHILQGKKFILTEMGLGHLD